MSFAGKIGKVIALSSDLFSSGGEASHEYRNSVSDEEYNPAVAFGKGMLFGGVDVAADVISDIGSDALGKRALKLAEKMGIGDDDIVKILTESASGTLVGGIADEASGVLTSVLTNEDHKPDAEEMLAGAIANFAFGMLVSAINIKIENTKADYSRNQKWNDIGTEVERAGKLFEAERQIFNSDLTIEEKRDFAKYTLDYMKGIREAIREMSEAAGDETEKDMLNLIDSIIEELSEHVRSRN